MDFGNSESANMDYNTNAENTALKNSNSRPMRIMERSRITEEDLEKLRKNIIESHRRKHSRVLIISIIILMAVTVLFLIFRP